MLRRLHPEQPASFAFTPANKDWAEAQLTKFPEGRQASAVIPLLWRAQEQEGWLTRPAIEYVADMLGMAYIRVLEVATFYFMFQLQPVGSVAHIQICGTTSCMICGAEDLIGVCRDKIAANPHELSADGKFSWEEVECLGACANAPMAQIGKDYYEDLTAEGFAELIDRLAAGEVPQPGPQNGRFASEPASGLTSLDSDRVHEMSASATLATDIGDTVKRIDGTEVPIITGWLKDEPRGGRPGLERRVDLPGTQPDSPEDYANRAADVPANEIGIKRQEADAGSAAKPESDSEPEGAADGASEVENTVAVQGSRPAGLEAAREGGPDNLKKIKGVGPKLEALLHRLGFYHFDQIASWTENEVAWVDENLEGFKGRVTRDEWVSQAKLLIDGRETEFSKKVGKNDI